MMVNPILLQRLKKKYARMVDIFAEKARFTLDATLDPFYRSGTYSLISKCMCDLHCKGDAYLVDELVSEYQEKGTYGRH